MVLRFTFEQRDVGAGHECNLGILDTSYFCYTCIYAWLGSVREKRGVLGILIDERNRMSLSRFQILGWTLIVVSTVLVFGLKYQTLHFILGEQLLILLGISGATLGGASIIKNSKDVEPDDPELAASLSNKRAGVYSCGENNHIFKIIKFPEVMSHIATLLGISSATYGIGKAASTSQPPP